MEAYRIVVVETTAVTERKMKARDWTAVDFELGCTCVTAVVKSNVGSWPHPCTFLDEKLT